MAAVVTDPEQPNHPIVYANKRFEELTGYSNEEIIGQNCRFLQGEKTDGQAGSCSNEKRHSKSAKNNGCVTKLSEEWHSILESSHD
ncbi:PAS domain-containing protein [Planococcus maritimus]|uniref:PAS domain-containing protein n=1 Tax=Planococcus maritimus TaxID=192421 RepID=UPI003CC76FE8